MRTVTYQLVSVATGTTASAQSLPIIRPCTIIAVQWSVRIVGGAATGWVDAALNLNNTGTNFEEINNPPREVILGRFAVLSPGAGSAAATSPVSPASVALRIGDTLSISQTQFGTAPATFVLACLAICTEN